MAGERMASRESRTKNPFISTRVKLIAWQPRVSRLFWSYGARPRPDNALARSGWMAWGVTPGFSRTASPFVAKRDHRAAHSKLTPRWFRCSQVNSRRLELAGLGILSRGRG